MDISIDQLVEIMPSARKRASIFTDLLNAGMARFGINTPHRQAAFLAQIAHESGSLVYVRELASGAAYDTGKKAINLGNTPEEDGDGQRYKGRGLIQITGRANYMACGKALGLDLIAQPELLEEPHNAALSACWFWSNAGLNAIADRGDFLLITKRINGGTNGWAERKTFWEKAKWVLGIAD